MSVTRLLFGLLIGSIGGLAFASSPFTNGSSIERGLVEVRGRDLLRDGHRWVPHGFYQIAFEVAPANLSRAHNPFWAKAYNGYAPGEYAEMRRAGADSVRIQVSQAASDPQSPLFDAAFVDKAVEAVWAARKAGLTVIVCVQDEAHVPGDNPIPFPDDGTGRVWKKLAPKFAQDHGVMFELLNEPRPQPSPQNWVTWRITMMRTLQTVREAGATNVAIADGLGLGQILTGAPLLDDPQVAYASHPYAFRQYGQTRQAWDAKFGDFSRRATVIITEWISNGFYCDADTPMSSLDFFHYLDEHGIGLEVGAWDWPPMGFGSVRQGFPKAQFSSYAGRTCKDPLYGPGKMIETWFSTNSPPNTVE